MQWRTIHHNFFIDNYSPQEGVDNDDGSGYYKTHVSRLLAVSGVWVPKENEIKDAQSVSSVLRISIGGYALTLHNY